MQVRRYGYMIKARIPIGSRAFLGVDFFAGRSILVLPNHFDQFFGAGDTLDHDFQIILP